MCGLSLEGAVDSPLYYSFLQVLDASHLLCTRFDVKEDNAVAARVNHQVLLDKMNITLHVRLQPEQVPVAQNIPRTRVRHGFLPRLEDYLVCAQNQHPNYFMQAEVMLSPHFGATRRITPIAAR